jgi:hypothetical protein
LNQLFWQDRNWHFWDIGLVAFGDISHHLDVKRLAKRLNRSSPAFCFTALQSVTDIPVPTMPPAKSGTSSPQYAADALFALLRSHGSSRTFDILVGIIDSEIYDEMFSLLDPANRLILISTRTPHIQTILAKSNRTFYNYVGLEIAAQLLCALYRLKVGIQTRPEECQPPWHIERLNCLYDWYGMSPANVTKLLRPRISPRALAYFNAASLSPVYILSIEIMSRSLTRNTLSVLLRRLGPDPYVSLILGSVLGFATSTLSTSTLWYSSLAFYLIATTILLWRGLILLGDRSRIG